MPSEIQFTQESRRPTLTATLTTNWRPRVLGAAIAILACVLIWFVGGAVGASFVVSFGDEGATMDITLGPVIGSVFAGAVAGWVLLVVLELFTTRARTVWTAIALAVAVGSMLPALGYEADVETTLSLTLMHAAAAAVIILFFRRRARSAGEDTREER